MLSPCIHVCKLNNDVCVGCYRTLEEIANWTNYSEEQRLTIIDRIYDTINRNSSKESTATTY
jgi:predicted Fe-S protein YdhL (DUF1289 family)